MKLAPPSVLRQTLLTIALVVACTAALAGTATAATPTAAGVAGSGSATSQLPGGTRPSWNDDNGNDRDRHNSRDRDRDRTQHGPSKHGWRWKRWVVSPWQCRQGHGHVDWRHGRCWGGRFGGAWVRSW